MTLPVECQEKHGYVLVDLQHIVRDLASYCCAMLWLCVHVELLSIFSVTIRDLGLNSIVLRQT